MKINKNKYINEILSLKDDILSIDCNTFDFSMILKEIIKDVEVVEDLIKRIEDNSNWEIIELSIKEFYDTLDIVKILLSKKENQDIIIYKKPIHESSKIVYKLLYNTNKYIKSTPMIEVTRKLKSKY